MKRMTALLLACLFALSLIACGKDGKQNNVGKETDTDTGTIIYDTDFESETEAMTIQNIRPVYPEDGASVNLMNETVWAFVDGYTLQRTNRLTAFSRQEDYYPETLTLSFACDEEVDYYRVSVSRRADMSDADTYLVGTPELVLDHLYTGTAYFWQVDAVAADKIYRSAVYAFSTVAGPRTLRLDGVSNTRDAGGMTGIDGYRIKQGMIYRGGYVQDITSDSRHFFVDVLGVKTDLDLRKPSEGGAGASTGSPLGSDIRYINIEGRYYTDAMSGGNGINSVDNQAIMAEELRVFADPDNYPVYIHCSLGRDRTGTLVMLIQGLLGASKDAMALDYEISSLSVNGTLDSPSADFFPSRFNSIYTYINRTYTGDTFADKVEAYMLSIGLTHAEIDSIRTVMLEKVD